MAMNEQDRAEFERLKQRQAELMAQFIELGRKLSALETRMAAAVEPAMSKPAPTQPTPPPIIQAARPVPEVRQPAVPKPEPTRTQPSPIPRPAMHIPEKPAAPVTPEPAPAFAQSRVAA